MKDQHKYKTKSIPFCKSKTHSNKSANKKNTSTDTASELISRKHRQFNSLKELREYFLSLKSNTSEK